MNNHCQQDQRQAPSPVSDPRHHGGTYRVEDRRDASNPIARASILIPQPLCRQNSGSPAVSAKKCITGRLASELIPRQKHGLGLTPTKASATLVDGMT